MPTLTVRERRRRAAATRPGASSYPSALTASGVQVSSRSDDKRRLNAESVKRLRKPWQLRSFDYYNVIPEVWYAAQFYSRHMSKIDLRVERLDDQGDYVPMPDSPAAKLLNAMRDTTGGRGDIIGTYGRLRFLVGECYLVCLDPDTSDERWETLSMRELLPNESGKGYKRIADGQNPEEIAEAPEDNRYDMLENTARVWRLWRRHPEFSLAADSPMRAVQDVCEELLLLTLAVRAQARSRIAKSGILLVPSEISPPPVAANPGDPLEDKFLRDLTMHMEAPLADEGVPAQLVPLLVRGPAAYLKELRQLQLHVSGADYPEAQLREEAIGRLANGLDMPREVLLGTADVNHWGAWQIDQQTWAAHVQPVVEEFCQELTSAVLWPALEDSPDTSLQRDEVRRWRVWYDAVKITNHPNRGQDAQDVYDRGGLSKEALREAKGFDDADAPTEAERAEYIGIRVRDAGLAWYGEPSMKSGSTPEAPPPPSDVAPQGDEIPTETPPSDGGTGQDVRVGPPVGAGADTARLLGAAEHAVQRCRHAAGSKLLSKVPRQDRQRYAVIPKGNIFAHLGAQVRELNGDTRLADPEWLVQGGTDEFEHLLEGWGYPPERIQAMTRLVQQHAAKTLHQERPEALPVVLLNL